ncbi:hypothetical protein F4804DRAFT_298361 [Jackrogersella minutella]|nr:hypothetical protein F4804DRAFT_298361 [Jackrogersella minutella]
MAVLLVMAALLAPVIFLSLLRTPIRAMANPRPEPTMHSTTRACLKVPPSPIIPTYPGILPRTSSRPTATTLRQPMVQPMARKQLEVVALERVKLPVKRRV